LTNENQDIRFINNFEDLNKNYKINTSKERVNMTDNDWVNKVEVAEDAAQNLCENYYKMIRIRNWKKNNQTKKWGGDENTV